MKKTLWTLNVENYAPEITQITYPFLAAYASKIGANFQIINKREWPHVPAVYEKLQIFELGRENDWNIFIDSDVLVFPDMFDVTERVSKDTVIHFDRDHAGNRWRYDEYFRRDGRDIGSCNWFAAASNWCLDLWHPLDDMEYDEAIARIQPTVKERAAGIQAEHLIDDYVVSRNIARYGLKFKTVKDIIKDSGDPGQYFWHRHMVAKSTKVLELSELQRQFRMNNVSEATMNISPATWLRDYGIAPAGAVKAAGE